MSVLSSILLEQIERYPIGLKMRSLIWTRPFGSGMSFRGICYKGEMVGGMCNTGMLDRWFV